MKIMYYDAFVRNHKSAKNRNLLNNPLTFQGDAYIRNFIFIDISNLC